MLAAVTLAQADACDEELTGLGRQVQAVHRAISDPATPGAMQAIRELGTDSRYYTMVRGWLAMQLKGDESIVAASGPGQRPKIEARIMFVNKALRAIDLE